MTLTAEEFIDAAVRNGIVYAHPAAIRGLEEQGLLSRLRAAGVRVEENQFLTEGQLITVEPAKYLDFLRSPIPMTTKRPSAWLDSHLLREAPDGG